MTPRAQPPRPAREPRRPIDGIVAADSLESALRIAARALGKALGAARAGILVFEDQEVVTERWWPEPPGADAIERRAALLESPRRHLGRGARVIPIEHHSRCLGALCVSGIADDQEEGPEVQTLLRAVACRLAADLGHGRAKAMETRYERWFRTLDEQIRVLDRERQKFAAVVHASDAAVFVADLSRHIRWTNTVMAERVPQGAASWVGLECLAACRGFAGGGRQPCGECPVGQALERNAVVHREVRNAEGGKARSLYLSALPIRDPEGLPREAMVMIQDLSDLEILKASEERYRLLFERSGKAILMIALDTRGVLLANPAASRVTGYAPEDLLAVRLQDLHPPEEWRELDRRYQRAIAEGSMGAHECRIRTREGSLVPVIVTGARTDLDGRPVLMLEFQDLTETRRVREALHRAELQLRAVVAGSPIVLFAIDREGIFTLSEGRGLARLGLAPGEVVGRSAADLYGDHPEILECIRRALGGEELTRIVEVVGLSFETTYAPLRGPDGEVDGVLGVANDVTERRRLEDQLRHAQRMEAIGRLAGGVAHDFNNLLAAILGNGELMLNRLEPGHPMRHNAEEIQKAATRGALLTRQLLAFGRKEVLSLTVVDLNAVLAGMEGMLRRLIGEDIQLDTVPAPRVAPVRADRSQLEQVILNLVVNARDAMPQGGRVTVEISEVVLDEAYVQRHAGMAQGPHVRLAVTDSGSGMDAEVLAHVFEPFFTTKERGRGTGLGLATVYGIVEQSGGHVEAYSEPGMGSCFKVYLPRAELPVAAEAPAPAAEPVRGSETLLLVEDEEAVRSTARDALEDGGYHVLEAEDGVHALQVAEAFPGTIHLLVTDVVMPRMGGGELAQRLLAVRPEVRVLFVSGYPDDALVRHGVMERGSALLQKPFALAELIRKVREVLESAGRKAA